MEAPNQRRARFYRTDPNHPWPDCLYCEALLVWDAKAAYYVCPNRNGDGPDSPHDVLDAEDWDVIERRVEANRHAG